MSALIPPRKSRTAAARVDRRLPNGVRTSLPADYPIPPRLPPAPAQHPPMRSPLTYLPIYGDDEPLYVDHRRTKPIPHAQLMDLFRELEGLRRDCWRELVGIQRVVPDLLRHVQAETGNAMPPALVRGLAHVSARPLLQDEAAAWAQGADAKVKVLHTVIADLVRYLDGAALPAWIHEPMGRRYRPWLDRCVERKKAVDALANKIALANLGLAMKSAMKLSGRGNYAFSDLINEGFQGLLRAVDRFQVDRGFHFSTYAMHWIRHALSRALSNNGRLVRIPVHMQQRHIDILRARAEIGSDDPKAVADHLGLKEWSMQIFQTGQAAFFGHRSLDQPLNEFESETLADRVPDLDQDLDATLLSGEASAVLRDQLAKIPRREREILKRRFGIDCEPQTLSQIGVEYGLSRERIRQLESEALTTLRDHLNRIDQPPAAKVRGRRPVRRDPEAAANEEDCRDRLMAFFQRFPDIFFTRDEIAQRLEVSPMTAGLVLQSLYMEGHVYRRNFAYAGPLTLPKVFDLILGHLGSTPIGVTPMARAIGVHRERVVEGLTALSKQRRITKVHRSYVLADASPAAPEAPGEQPGQDV